MLVSTNKPWTPCTTNQVRSATTDWFMFFA